ncbi:GNAT family N-acetyltransferase [Homoserinibacter sp. YIM 151385]|uniref:GNAT family N-acetyltransferase n=1 Tax=Homoserinibacter sp. YIM 151385 TaxID=2985506 RepID=UPI0022F03F91|nr:GNAT family N-acetyltransferase [Homoserinibacter sp. YIM 151385]WBU38913.1 GNAT family N-acetyltransferase [Homoserinibacter sp. YIM 151385]
MVSMRPASPADPASHALLAEYFADRARGFPAEQGEYRTTFPDPAAFEGGRGVFLLVEDEELGPVGCGGIRLLSPGRAEVKHLYLQPRTRGRGLGRVLLSELERLAAGLGATEVVLDTNRSLAAAGGLYRASGYESTEPYNDNPNATDWYRKPL